MSGDVVLVTILLFALGFGFIYGGVLFHLGHWRSWYLAPDTMFGARLGLYGLIPAGLALICTAISINLTTLEMRQFGLGYISSPLIGLAILMMLWQPKWIQPKWVYWLETYNADILDLIVEEGRKTENWGQVISTQEGLETWVAEVRQKHNLPPVSSEIPIPQHKGRFQRQWPIGLLIMAVSAGAGQYLLGNGFIGFIIGGLILGLIARVVSSSE